jgi:drug/metabolite transporter (DMT)-like permease
MMTDGNTPPTRRRMSPRQRRYWTSLGFAGVIGGIVGGWMVIDQPDGSSAFELASSGPLSAGFAIGASISFGVALHLIGRWLPAIDGRLRTLMYMVVVAVVTIAAGAATTGFHWPADATGWTGLTLLTVLYGTAITGLFVVLPRLGAVNNAAIMNFEPVAALGMAWAVLGQSVSPVQLLGGAIVIGAIVYLSTGPRPGRG